MVEMETREREMIHNFFYIGVSRLSGMFSLFGNFHSSLIEDERQSERDDESA